MLLASRSGTGPTLIGGLQVPLTLDGLLTQMLAGTPQPALVGARGTLDANASATATLSVVPAMAPLIGTSLHFGALTFDPVTYTGHVSSGARVLRIVP